MATAPFQVPPLQTAASGAAVDCIRQVALAFLGSSSADAAGLTQDAIGQASQVDSTGRCQVPAAPYAMNDSSASVALATPPAVPAVAAACPQSGSAAVLLPGTLAAQGLCGQRVATTAISPGDLVFWNYSNNAPTRVGVAVSASDIITSDPSTGRVVEQALPSGKDVRVKRVLASNP
jgi:hypothetical protein